ncbi:MAG: DUF4301 family protein [Rikenellaceae bacterium]|nr:DUF4301 family protein [Rikenellaceae bacterium]
MFSQHDLEQMKGKGIGQDTVRRQIENFRNGFPFLAIDRPVTVGDGILRLDPDRMAALCCCYESMTRGKSIVKFVPASGAATRMFKDLYEYIDGKPDTAAERVCDNICDMAFYDALRKTGVDMSDRKAVAQAIVGDDGLGYGRLPKGLLLFHRYDDGAATPFEEHLAEGALYARSGDRVAIHFTVSPEHRAEFEKLAARAVPDYQRRYGVVYDITYSEQMPSTDTIAVNEDFTPFRQNDGTLLFRPAGHGALIANLDKLSADIIFIKTVDNVTHRSLIDDTVKYKKLLAALLIELQDNIFALLRRLDAGCDRELIDEAARFVEKKMMYTLPGSFSSLDDEGKRAALRAVLDRPVRVCGMVRNEGEPGGGPFWVRKADGSCSLQIAESSQISPQDKPLMQKSTHFNPVDLVCGVKDYKGDKFDLARFVNPQTGFISKKSKEGRDLLAQELPGLWNGAMADWTTIFVEVPISTFNPVKTVTDLLRPTHQQ